MTYDKKDFKLKIVLINEKTIVGNVNIAGYDRLSDFLDQDTSVNLKIYDAVYTGNFKLGFILVPKSKVLYYSPETTNTYKK